MKRGGCGDRHQQQQHHLREDRREREDHSTTPLLQCQPPARTRTHTQGRGGSRDAALLNPLLLSFNEVPTNGGVAWEMGIERR